MNRTRICKAASPGYFWAHDKAEGGHRADPDGQIPDIWPCAPVPLHRHSTQNLLSPHHAQAWSHQTLQSLKLCISARHFDPLGSTRWPQPASSNLFFTSPPTQSLPFSLPCYLTACSLPWHPFLLLSDSSQAVPLLGKQPGPEFTEN